MLAWLLASTLMGQDVRAWQGLHEGLLMESADGDLDEAIAWYEGWIAGLPPEDPTQAELHYWLGRAYYAKGEYESARKALLSAMGDPTIRLQAQVLMGQIDAQELQVRKLPIAYDFTTGTGHFLHSWLYPDKGSIRSELPPESDNPALAWRTKVLEREDDAIEIWFDPDLEGPEHIEFRVHAKNFRGLLVLAADDDKGRRYIYPEPIVAPIDEWVLITADLSSFVLQDTGGLAEGHMSPGSVVSISLWDRTSFGATSRGENVIYLDDLELR